MTSDGFSPNCSSFCENWQIPHRRVVWAHRQAYDAYLLAPPREFVSAMGAGLRPILGEDIHAEPKVRGSIFAITRDTRFSPDKKPYKLYLDLWFWRSDGPSHERPEYRCRLTSERLIRGAGMHGFPEAAINAVNQGQPGVERGGQTFKRVPAGFPGRCCEHFARFVPLQRWLVDVLPR